MIRHPEPPPRLVPLRLAICMIGASLVLAIVGVSLVAWSAAAARHRLAESFEHKVVALEAQVTAMCQSTPDPATCKPVTQTPIVLVVPATTMVTTTTTVPFPPSTLAPAATAPANPPASAAQAPAPASQPPTPTTTAPPPPTTTPPATAPCTSLPVVGCVTRASRSATRSTECGGWYDLVASYDWSASTACRVLMCESGGDPNAVNRSSNARGLMQILGGPLDPEENVALAYSMWSERGWQPWVCR